MSIRRYIDAVVMIEGRDASPEIGPLIQSLSFSDSLSGRADEVTIDVDNRDGRFFREWYVAQGSALIIKLIPTSAEVGELSELNLGGMTVDDPQFSGFPHTLSIRAITAAMHTRLRRFKRNNLYTRMSISQIGKEIADRAEMDFVYDAPELPKYGKREQKKKSDLLFLHELAKEAALECKVTNNQLVIFDRKKYEAKEPITALDFGDLGKTPYVTGYNFAAASTEQYAACTVKYYDYEAAKVLKATYNHPTITDGPTLEITKRCDSRAEAETIARTNLWRAHLGAITASLTLTGAPALMAGACITCNGLGTAFSRKYMIARADHRLLGDGWTTSVEMDPVFAAGELP